MKQQYEYKTLYVIDEIDFAKAPVSGENLLQLDLNILAKRGWEIMHTQRIPGARGIGVHNICWHVLARRKCVDNGQDKIDDEIIENIIQPPREVKGSDKSDAKTIKVGSYFL